MNPMTNAMLELKEMDELSHMDTPIHGLHPLAKFLVTIVYIFTVVSFPKYNLSGLIPMVLYPVVVFQLSGLSIGACFYKLRLILPIICAVGIWNPLFDRTPAAMVGPFLVTGGMISLVTLMIKGILAMMASFLLVATTGMEHICCALRMLHVPELLVTQLLMTWRYISLLLEEAGTMMDAYHLRAPGQKGVHFKAWGSFLGQLLLRSMDRSQALYESMRLRGFSGEFYYGRTKRFQKRDGVYLTLCLFLFFFLRYCNLSVLIGNLLI